MLRAVLLAVKFKLTGVYSAPFELAAPSPIGYKKERAEAGKFFINWPVPSATIMRLLLNDDGVVTAPKVGIVREFAPKMNWPFCKTTPALVPAPRVRDWLNVTPAVLLMVMVVLVVPQVAAKPLPVTCATLPL